MPDLKFPDSLQERSLFIDKSVTNGTVFAIKYRVTLRVPSLFVMAHEDELHSCITKFMIAICCSFTKSFAADDFLYRVGIRNAVNAVYDDAEFEMFTSGSSAELYITPVLAHIGDIDVMLCHNSTKDEDDFYVVESRENGEDVPVFLRNSLNFDLPQRSRRHGGTVSSGSTVFTGSS